MPSTLRVKDKFALIKRKILVHNMGFRNLVKKSSLLGEAEAIISVTSFGLRIHAAALAIESIAAGNQKPKRIILYLEENLKTVALPRSIKRLMRRGLEVKYVPDYKSYKKFWFALEESIAEGLPLVTIDDDVLYPSWFLEKMLDASRLRMDAVYCYRAREMAFGENGIISQYNQWDYANNKTPQHRIFITGCSGLFLPQPMIRALLTEGSRFLICCPTADDVWLNYVAAKNEINVFLILDHSIDFTPLETENAIMLWSSNERGGNDVQISSTYEPKLLKQLAK